MRYLHGLVKAVSSLWVVCCPWVCCVAPPGTALAGLWELPKKKKRLWGPAAILPLLLCVSPNTSHVRAAWSSLQETGSKFCQIFFSFLYICTIQGRCIPLSLLPSIFFFSTYLLLSSVDAKRRVFSLPFLLSTSTYSIARTQLGLEVIRWTPAWKRIWLYV